MIFFLAVSLKTYIIGTRSYRLIEAVPSSTHDLCFRAKLRKISKPHFYCMNVGCKGSILHGHVSMIDIYLVLIF